MPSTSPIDIPEITNLIASYLEGRDFETCVCVSRSWREAFLHHRWRVIEVGATLGACWYDFFSSYGVSIFKYRHLIEDLSLVGYIDVPDQFSFPNVRNLRVMVHQGEGIWIPKGIVPRDLNRTCPLLVRLELDHVDTGTVFWVALSTHPHIKVLRLKGVYIETFGVSRGFWDVCKKLEVLEMVQVSMDGTSIPNDVVLERLQELVMDCVTGLDGHRRTPLNMAVKSPMLRYLEWESADHPKWDHVYHWGELEYLNRVPAQTKPWPHLNTLRINWMMYDKDMATLLKGCGNGAGGIVDLQLHRCPLGRHAIKALALHFNTLVEVTLNFYSPLASLVIRDVLSYCPSLKTLHARSIFAKDIVEGGPWICQQLQKLVICVLVAGSEQDLPLIFERLSTLTRLEHLA
ncbi:hypothetical protein BGX34_008549, partial [Mortierella sp. NVP85]